MPNIVIMSELKLWSMAPGKGAPSFYNTVKGYCDAGWNVVLLNIDSDAEIEENALTLYTHRPIKLPFPNAYRYPKIGYFGKIINQENVYRQFCRIATDMIAENGWEKDDTILYAYEVAAVKAAAHISKKLGIPFVTRFQGTVIKPSKSSFNVINRIRLYPHPSALAEKADAVIMTNDGTLGDKVLRCARNMSEHIYFWRNGVNMPDFSKIDSAIEDKLIDDGDKLLITVSRLAHWKRIDRAIHAVAKVVETQPNCKLLIIGEGDARKELETLANQLGVNQNVIFVGSIPQAKVYQYMKRADVFLSLYDLSNLGNPLMEAMICGLPIITLNNGDTSTVIKHNETGVLLDLDNVDAVPDYINKILNDREFANHLSENVFLFAKREFWSWEQRIETEINTISELLSFENGG